MEALEPTHTLADCPMRAHVGGLPQALVHSSPTLLDRTTDRHHSLTLERRDAGFHETIMQQHDS